MMVVLFLFLYLDSFFTLFFIKGDLIIRSS